jgi:uncharacterized protein YcfL
MKPSPLLRGVLAGAALLAAAGCGTSPKSMNTVEPAQTTAVRQPIADRRVVTDPSLARNVQPVDLIEGRTPDGLLRIQLTVHNPTRSRHAFNHRVEWFDAQGFQFGTPTDTAVSAVIEGGQTLSFGSVAPNPQVRDFRISLLESTRSFFPRLRRN